MEILLFIKIKFIMKQNFLTSDYSLDFELPNPRLINGFRLIPVYSAPDSLGNKRIIWLINPNKSVRAFYFPNLESAMDFAKSHSNCHTDKFWFNKFKRQYHFMYVSRNIF